MDGCAPTISKQVPQRNLSLCGTNTPLCPWWDWLFVLMGGSFKRSQFHLHPPWTLTPYRTVPYPTFHFLPFMPFTMCYFFLVAILLFLFYFFPSLPRSIGPLRSRVSPFLLYRFSLFSPFPRFHSPLAQHLYTSSRSKKSASRFFRAQKICISHFLFIT